MRASWQEEADISPSITEMLLNSTEIVYSENNYSEGKEEKCSFQVAEML